MPVLPMIPSISHSFRLALALVATAAVGCNEPARNAGTEPPASLPRKMPVTDPLTQNGSSGKPMPELTPEEAHVIVHKGTEPPFTGKYVHHKADGAYVCRRCGTPLFSSGAKFESGTGWPSFDDALPGAVDEVPDPDGLRTEIVCAHCGAHLGHVFRGEGFTDKNARHCVNSLSLSFTAESPPTGHDKPQTESTAAEVPHSPQSAYFAGGCFWGVEYYFEKVPGVLDVTSGYMGGSTDSPTYQEVSSNRTGHAETVRVTYDPARTSYEELARLFFEIHDPTQVDRQGPDVGPQYRSAVFVSSENERKTVRSLIAKLEHKGLKIATRVEKAGRFWQAESYHQDYYQRTGKQPYCHARVKRF